MWKHTDDSKTTWLKHNRPVHNTKLIYNKGIGTEICPPRETIKISMLSGTKHTYIFDTGARVPTTTGDTPKRIRLTNIIIYDRKQDQRHCQAT